MYILADNTDATKAYLYLLDEVYSLRFYTLTSKLYLIPAILNRTRVILNMLMPLAPLQHILLWHDIAYSISRTK